MMKITKTDVFWWVVLAVALVVIITGCLAMVTKSSATYDESKHRAEITRIYPSVRWSEYRDAAREICRLDDSEFGYVAALATSDGPQAALAFSINVEYLCPNRLKSDF
jgi:hypothetical protein